MPWDDLTGATQRLANRTRALLAIDEQACLLDHDGASISELYACDDDAASVMGFGNAGAARRSARP